MCVLYVIQCLVHNGCPRDETLLTRGIGCSMSREQYVKDIGEAPFISVLIFLLDVTQNLTQIGFKI